MVKSSYSKTERDGNYNDRYTNIMIKSKKIRHFSVHKQCHHDPVCDHNIISGAEYLGNLFE